MSTLGPIEFERRVYVDQAVVEGKCCVHLLDQELGVEKEGLMSEEVCQLAASAVCESSYRGAAKLVREATGMHISPQGVWNLIQKLGKRQGEQVERHEELAAEKMGRSTARLVFYANFEKQRGDVFENQAWGISQKKSCQRLLDTYLPWNSSLFWLTFPATGYTITIFRKANRFQCCLDSFGARWRIENRVRIPDGTATVTAEATHTTKVGHWGVP